MGCPLSSEVRPSGVHMISALRHLRVLTKGRAQSRDARALLMPNMYVVVPVTALVSNPTHEFQWFFTELSVLRRKGEREGSRREGRPGCSAGAFSAASSPP